MPDIGTIAASWAPEVEVERRWSRNSLRFATESEARQSAQELFGRWTLCTGHRATPATEPPNYRLEDGQLVALDAIKDTP